MVRPRTRTDDEILSAARDCFLELGVNVSTQIIARRLGLSAPALFHRFGSKRDLLIASMVPGEEDLPLGGLTDPDPDRPLQEQLFAIGIQLNDFLTNLMPRIAVLHAAGIHHVESTKSLRKPPPLIVQQRLTDWLRLAQGIELIAPCNPSEVAIAFMGSLHMPHIFQMRFKINEAHLVDENYIHHLSRLYARGLNASQETA